MGNLPVHVSRLAPYPGTHWTVLGYLGVLSGTHNYSQCRGACGEEHPVDWACLVRGKTRSFGRDPNAWPHHFSNVQWERLCSGEKMGCSYCFPHGLETTTSRWDKGLRCWKRYRQTQWHGFSTQRRAAQHRVRHHTRQRGWYWHRPPKWARQARRRSTATAVCSTSRYKLMFLTKLMEDLKQ